MLFDYRCGTFVPGWGLNAKAQGRKGAKTQHRNNGSSQENRRFLGIFWLPGIARKSDLRR